jgi:hypothetical protein
MKPQRGGRHRYLGHCAVAMTGSKPIRDGSTVELAGGLGFSLCLWMGVPAFAWLARRLRSLRDDWVGYNDATYEELVGDMKI